MRTLNSKHHAHIVGDSVLRFKVCVCVLFRCGSHTCSVCASHLSLLLHALVFSLESMEPMLAETPASLLFHRHHGFHMESNTIPNGIHWIPCGMEGYPPWIPWNSHMDYMEQIPNSMEIVLGFQGNNSILLLLLSKICRHQKSNTQLHNLSHACTTELLQLYHTIVTRYEYKAYK